MSMKIETTRDEQRRSMTFRADMECLREVLGFVGDTLRAAGVADDAVGHVKLAVEEIFVNIALYAYKDGARGVVELRCSVRDGAVSLEFEDSGVPFDPLSRKDPDVMAGLEEREIGGLGVFIVKKIMDSVEYCREGGRNLLRVIKSL
jgi:anti-sigma regulatory factor (Ser/Thr protein kinase)